MSAKPEDELTPLWFNQRTFEWLPTRMMIVYRAENGDGAQRGEKPIAKRIAAKFDREKFGQLLVNKRRDGTISVIDGQQRLIAWRKLFGDELTVPCLVYHALSVDQEGIVFSRQGQIAPLTGPELFMAQLVARDSETVALNAIIERHGFHVAEKTGGGGDNRIKATRTLERLWRDGFRANLDEALGLLRLTWNGSRESLTGDMIEGLTRFVARYKSIYSKTHLVARLKKTPIEDIQRLTKSFLRVEGRYSAVSLAILKTYNDNTRSGRLPDWHAQPTRTPDGQ